MTDLTGLSLGLLAALAWGSTDVFASVVSRRIGSLRTSAASQLTSVGVVLALLVATGTPLPREPWVVAVSLACGLVSGVAYLAFYTALRHGPLSVVSPVISVYGSLTVVLSILLLGESLAVAQGLGVAVATGGVVLASVVVDGAGRRPRLVGPGVLYALVALVAFAGLVVGLSAPIRAAGWLPVLLLSRLANAAVAWTILAARAARRPGRAARPARGWRGPWGAPATVPPAAPITAADGAATDPAAIDLHGHPEWARLDRRAVALAIVVGLLDTGGFIAFAIGLQVAPTWLVGLSSSFGPVVAVIAGVAVFGERPRPVQWLGLGLVFGSIFLITLGG